MPKLYSRERAGHKRRSTGPLSDTICRMNPEDPCQETPETHARSKAVILQLLRYLGACDVVDLGQLRRLRRRLDTLERSPAPRTEVWLRRLRRQHGEQLYLFAGRGFLTWICDAAATCQKQGPADAKAVAAWLVQRSFTWRASRDLRRHVAMIHDVPCVQVPGHLRRGRRVRAHQRLIGNDHLRALPVEGWPAIVREVVRRLAEGAGGTVAVHPEARRAASEATAEVTA